MGSRDHSGKPYDLDGQLAICIQEYEGEREAYWKSRPEGGDWGLKERLRGHADSVAMMLLKGTHDMIDHNAQLDPPLAFTAEQTAYLNNMEAEITAFLDLVRQKVPKGGSCPSRS